MHDSLPTRLAATLLALVVLGACGDDDGGTTTELEEGGTIVGRLATSPDGLALALPSGRTASPTQNGAFVFTDVPAGTYTIEAVGSPYFYDEVVGQATVEVGETTDVGTLQQTRDRYVDAVLDLQGVSNFQRVIGYLDLDDYAELVPGEGNFIVLDMGAGEAIEDVEGDDFEIGDDTPDGPAGQYRVEVSQDGETFVADGMVHRGDRQYLDLADFGVTSARYVRILADDSGPRLGLRYVRTTY